MKEKWGLSKEVEEILIKEWAKRLAGIEEVIKNEWSLYNTNRNRM